MASSPVVLPDMLHRYHSFQHYVVHNVRNHTGWHIQLFHGPSNGARLKELFGERGPHLSNPAQDSKKPSEKPWHLECNPVLTGRFLFGMLCAV